MRRFFYWMSFGVELLGIKSLNKVTYLGHKKNDSAKIFLLVIISEPTQNDFARLKALIELRCKNVAQIKLFIHNVPNVIKSISLNNYFFNYALKFCPTVYNGNKDPISISAEIALKDYSIAANKNFFQEIIIAENCLEQAICYFDDKDYAKAIFNLHQAVETSLRSLIKYSIGYRINVHNIEELFAVCEIFSNDLISIFETKIKKGREAFMRLQKSYFESRHNNDYHVNKSCILKLIKSTRKLFDLNIDVASQYWAIPYKEGFDHIKNPAIY